MTANTTTSNGLDDIFGLGATNTTTNAQKVSKPTSDIMDLFNVSGGQSTTTVPKPTPNNGFDMFTSSSGATKTATKSLVVYEKNDVKIVFEPVAGGKHSNDEQHFIQMTAQNNNLGSGVKEFLFSAAVPKTMQMQLSLPSTSVIQPLDSLVQTIAISNPNKVIQI